MACVTPPILYQPVRPAREAFVLVNDFKCVTSFDLRVDWLTSHRDTVAGKCSQLVGVRRSEKSSDRLQFALT
eukprot:1191514-Amphidinium_carterae.1